MLIEAEVVQHEVMGDQDQKLRRLVLKGPIAREARPGQFVHIQVSSTYDPLLRRPFSIAQINAEQEEITVMYRVQGRGTELLAQASPGALLSVLGPLGNGFSLPDQGELWLVAGGIGVFPLYGLARAALESRIPARLFWGGENEKFLESAGLASWRALGLPVHLTTLDGSVGKKGLVTELFHEHLKGSGMAPQIRVAACGPHAMMQAVTAACLEAGLPVEVSLEERMGCAVGACLGCVATLRDEEGNWRRAKVCQEGPVFQGEEVVWDASC